MASVNIRRDVSDGFYRYKMPLLQTKIEGKGNGIKTVLPNISDIAKALSRPPTYPSKFFGCELGAQTVFDEKADRYIVNGAHDASRLRELLYNFIDKFVLCASCKNPETTLVLTKDDRIIRDCKACGKETPVDMRHKLVTFILRNPPPKVEKSKKSSSSKKSGKGTKSKTTDDGDDEEVDGLTMTIQGGAMNLPELNDKAGNDEWSVDTSKEAVAARVSELSSNVKDTVVETNGVANGDDDDGEGGSTYDDFAKWITDNKDASDVVIYKHAQELGIEKKTKTVLSLAQALFNDDIFENVKQHEMLFVKLVSSEKHQKTLLGALERFVGEINPDMMQSLPKLLMLFYQADIFDDEVLEYWGNHTSKKYVDKDVSKKVRKAAAPFLKWLEEAEDEDDDEE